MVILKLPHDIASIDIPLHRLVQSKLKSNDDVVKGDLSFFERLIREEFVDAIFKALETTLRQNNIHFDLSYNQISMITPLSDNSYTTISIAPNSIDIMVMEIHIFMDEEFFAVIMLLEAIILKKQFTSVSLTYTPELADCFSDFSKEIITSHRDILEKHLQPETIECMHAIQAALSNLTTIIHRKWFKLIRKDG